MNPSDFWTPWETTIDSWASAQSLLENVVARAAARNLVWRGVVDSSWALHSSLYRRLFLKLGGPPTEEQLLEQEILIMDRCQNDWRFAGIPALTLMAQLQHFGGPTRLLDVTSNPLIALWFAVEPKYDSNGLQVADVDGRLFAFDVSNRRIDFGSPYWSSMDVPWAEDYNSDGDWGRGRPWYWVPPSLNERIPAQFSGFLIDGVPKLFPGDNTRFRKRPGTGSTQWSINEVRLSTSVPTRLATQSRNPNKASTPTFTMRVAAEAKEPIRQRLQRSLGYRSSTLYPDLFGLAQHVLPELPR